ncbi:LysR family transcriptional regulator [Paracandidimonas lactea]|uniref:LysR family transcriptional regulator n=1 Tax=Paracandidimonas lactea TaxID=2895524 RepID=UPI001F2F27D8|nr:LysR family transcriptional regulator [Paracandidimonas lactea]
MARRTPALAIPEAEVREARKLDIPKLLTFIAVCEEGSISAAARRLHIAQPAVTTSIAKLESSLQTTLLVRSLRGVHTTASGRLLLERAYRITALARETLQEVVGLAHQPEGDVSIGLPSSVAAVLAQPLIVRLSEHYPRIRLRLVDSFSGYLWSWLMEGELDLALVFDRTAEPAVALTVLAQEDMHLVGAPAGMPAAKEIGVADLHRYPLAMPSRKHGIRSALESHILRHGGLPDVQLEIDAGIHLIRLVESGKWYTLLAPCAVAPEIRAGTLRAARLTPVFTRTIHLAQRRSTQGDAATQLVADELTALARQLMADGSWQARWFAGP